MFATCHSRLARDVISTPYIDRLPLKTSTISLSYDSVASGTGDWIVWQADVPKVGSIQDNWEVTKHINIRRRQYETLYQLMQLTLEPLAKNAQHRKEYVPSEFFGDQDDKVDAGDEQPTADEHADARWQ